MKPAGKAALVELTLFVTLVLSFIWLWARAFEGAGWVVTALGLGLSFTSHLRHGDTLSRLGIRYDNLWPALRDAMIPTLPLVAFFLVLAARGGRIGPAMVDPERFFRLLGWALLQQYLLQGFIHLRLRDLIPSDRARDATAGGIFAILHLPNPVLVPVTFLAGWVFAVLFRRNPNLPVLVLCHAIGSTAVAFAFDPSVLHRMRVGPGYLRF